MKYLVHAFLASVALTLLGCGGEMNLNHTPSISSVTQLPKGQSGVFVYRETMPVNSETVNIYIDGDYFTSLAKNHYRYVDLCAGQHSWNAVYHYADPGYLDKLNRQHTFTLNNGDVAYFKVSTNNYHDATLIPVSAQEAENVLGNLQLQDHTISRVTSGHSCQ